MCGNRGNKGRTSRKMSGNEGREVVKVGETWEGKVDEVGEMRAKVVGEMRGNGVK